MRCRVVYLDLTLHLFKSDRLRVSVDDGFVFDVLRLQNEQNGRIVLRSLETQRTETNDNFGNFSHSIRVFQRIEGFIEAGRSRTDARDHQSVRIPSE